MGNGRAALMHPHDWAHGVPPVEMCQASEKAINDYQSYDGRGIRMEMRLGLLRGVWKSNR